mmetsp:Transcript_35567/g.62825  ORF Transcript_35567/g.62825 Transcript_35567/m.62825 type:complete len:322 (-) Transcript_35567:81-1046(-)
MTLSFGPLTGALIAGVLHTVLGPDHLCTIVTLSACQGANAFWLGARWAGAHMVGLCIMGLLFSGLNSHASHINLEIYEHYADYAIGVMLLLVGGYFMVYADRYFDDEWSPRQATCACHSHLLDSENMCRATAGHVHMQETSPDSGSEHSCCASPCGHSKDVSYGAALDLGMEEARKGSYPGAVFDVSDKGRGLRKAGSMFAGFLQGIACPAGIVGITFLKQYNFTEMCVFVSMFFVVTTICMGALAALYGTLTRHCVSSAALGRCIYYGSCVMSLSLGCLWIILNATTGIDNLMGHDHSEHNHVHALQEPSSSTVLLSLIR